MITKILPYLLFVPLWFQNLDTITPGERAKLEAQNAELQMLLQKSQKMPFEKTPIQVQADIEGVVSWVAADRNGLIYLLQRGDKADPVVVVDRTGRVVRSWGKGMYTTPHAIRVDPQGNIWTTDA